MPPDEAAEEPIAIKEAAPTKKAKTRRKQVRSQKEHFARKFQRAGLITPESHEIPNGDTGKKPKRSRQAQRRENKRPRRAAAAGAATPSSSNTNDHPAEGQEKNKKDRDQVPDFEQPFAIRLKNSTAVAGSPSETLSLTLRPKGGRA
ncbi:hypothetical protein N7527_003828 [Penicillium freii]|uniref:Uncharacterized protein n=1 Tax=Penicillium freii TaxID=48697 RepID=A0A101MPI1_PENFR|nr:hypothetical protein N7527_003828 [Penicillium freii]KUM64299.1 hypothetical protein ACN42_g2774 [Penicillium freii]